MSKPDSAIDPRHLLIGLSLIASLYYIPAASLLGLITLLLFHWTSIPALAILGAGLFLLCLEWLLLNITPTYFLHINHWWLTELIHGNWQALFNGRTLLYSFPISMCYAAILSAVLKSKNGLQKELTQLSQGNTTRPSAFMSERKIQRQLNQIKTSAIEDGSVLGINRRTGKAVSLRDKDANLHTLAIGTTGCGNSVGSPEWANIVLKCL